MPRKAAKRAIVPPPPKRAAAPRKRDAPAPAPAQAPKQRRTLYRAHEPTSAEPSGLGAQLGGTARLELLCPRPPSTASLPPLPPLINAPTALAIELARVRALAGLRARLSELCRARGVEVAPMNAFERWRFLGTWSEAGSAAADPLLPSAAACASVAYAAGADAAPLLDGARSAAEWLAEDLCRAGVAAADAAAAAAALGAASDAARVEIGRAARDAVRARPPNVTVETHADDAALRWVTVSGAEAPIVVSAATLQKLRTLYRGDARSESDFLQRAAALLLRYDAIGGAGLHASLGADVHEALREAAGCAFECCASPLNTYFGAGAYCSPFADVEAPFGSRGSFAAFSPARGSFEVNPPFGDGMIDAVVCHLLRLLAAAQAAAEALAFVVVLPGWRDSRGWRALDESPLLRRRLLVAAADHGFVDGAQHARRASFRQSPYDSTLFFLQSDSAHAARPLSDEQLAAVERALAACAPSARALDSVALHERVERGGARRRLKRSRERRDG